MSAGVCIDDQAYPWEDDACFWNDDDGPVEVEVVASLRGNIVHAYGKLKDGKWLRLCARGFVNGTLPLKRVRKTRKPVGCLACLAVMP